MPHNNIFNWENTEKEFNFFSDVHRDLIKNSGIFSEVFLLDLDNTVGDAFSQDDLTSDNYDALYNEHISRVGRKGRIYTPPVEIRCWYLLPEWTNELKMLGISEISESLIFEVNLAELYETLNLALYSAIFSITSLQNEPIKLKKTDTQIQLLKNDDSLITSWGLTDNFDIFLNYFKQSEDDYFTEIIYNKSHKLSRIKWTDEIILEPNVKKEFYIVDEDFLGVQQQTILKLGDIIKTHTGKFYEIVNIFASDMKVSNYASLKIEAHRMSLSNIELPYEKYDEIVYNYKKDIIK